MKIFKFFVKEIFFRKAILTLSMVLLLFVLNYTAFIAGRSILSTYLGYQEIKCMDQEGFYIANLDPESDMNIDDSSEKGIQIIYDYLSNNFDYAFYTDGFIISLPNDEDMEISLGYMNEAYYNLNKFELSKGTDLDFDCHFEENEEVPVLIGKGLSKEYPVGSTIKIEDPALGKEVVLKVQGVLKQNTCHSNFYALNSKYYYNFSILLPVNEEFIKGANFDLGINGLMDIVIIQSTEEKIKDLSEIIQEHIGLKMNFFSQQENFDYFSEYYMDSLKGISIVSVILIVLIICLSVWIALVSIRLMLRDFTINLLVGLSYRKLRNIFYGYFGILYFINLIVIFIITASNRYGCWLRKDATFATYGLFGMIGMDWLALLIVLIFDIIIGLIIVESMMKKIKKIPISLGVLQ